MSAIETLFRESRGQPVDYRGKVIQMMDVFELEGVRRLYIRIESTKSDMRQGVFLVADGYALVNNQKIKGKPVVLWEDTAPELVELEVCCKKKLWLKNVWEDKRGYMDSWHNGAAMIVEPLENGRRYRCNDGEPDDDFDDIIFRVEFESSAVGPKVSSP